MTEIAPQHHLAVQAGANCGACPLHNQHLGPVPPSLHAGRIPFLVIAEAPSPIEVDEGQTLIGPGGREVRNALEAAGMAPAAVSYTNAMLCRPPGGDLEDYLRDCKRQGKPSPLDCCRPRLEREMALADFKLIVGAAAVRATKVGESVLKLRGTPVMNGTALPTLHPAFVLRDSGKLMRPIFRHDVSKAVRLSRGGNTWQNPPFTVVWDAPALAATLARMDLDVSVDTETDGIDPWTCRVRRVGFSDGRTNVIFSPLSVHGHWMVPDSVRAECWAVVRSFLATERSWYFHNFYAFDSIVLSQHGVNVNEKHLFDSLIGHHIGSTSEYPHGLDFLGSIYTDAPRWKDDVKHSTTRSDEVLDRYLSFDTHITRIAGPYVKANVGACDQSNIYNFDANLAKVGREMSRLGIRIDHGKRLAFVIEYQSKANRLREEFLQAAGREVNPGSPKQLIKLLYEDFGLPVLGDYLTDAGEPSTAEPVLLELLSMGVDARARKLIHSLLGWRGADKILGTYVGRFEDGQLTGGPPTHVDGRLRATWKVHGTTSGRWSSGDPMNLQNVPDVLRSMFIPEPGNVFVAADKSADELRIQALLANDLPLIKAFDEFDRGVGPDIHTFNACTLFKTTPDKVTKEVRVFAKRFVYGLTYGAGPPKIFQTLSLLRDEHTWEPVFAGLSLAEVEKVFAAWWLAHPAIVYWQKQLIAGWRKTGYIASPWHGRRRYFCAGENHEEMKNHPIQSGAADQQNDAVLRAAAAYPFSVDVRRGIVLQVHDQIVIECGPEEVDRCKLVLKQSMEKQIGPMRFPAEPKSGANWKEVS
jgi:DNA polymerase-1